MCKLVYTLYTDKYKTLLRKTKEHVKKEKEKEKMEASIISSWTRSLTLSSRLAWAATTEHHRLGGLHNLCLFLIVLEGGSPRSRCRQVWFLVRTLFLACGRPLSGWGLAWPSCGGASVERALAPALLERALIPPSGLLPNLIAS